MAALGTLTATTLEAALLEVALKLQEAESALTPAADNVQVTIDADDEEATITVTLPIAITTGASGAVVAAVPYA